VRHFAVFFAIALSPSPNLHMMARRIAKSTLFVKYVDQWLKFRCLVSTGMGVVNLAFPQRPNAGT